METIHRKTSRKAQVRWEDDVRNDLKKMKIKKWTRQVQDRLKWKGTVEKAKILPEMQRHRRRRNVLISVDNQETKMHIRCKHIS
jgi:hypothetical protein